MFSLIVADVVFLRVDQTVPCVLRMFVVLKHRTTRYSSSRRRLKKASPSTVFTSRKFTITRPWTMWVYTTTANLRFVQILKIQESSAKLTNQRVSYAFTSSPFSFHARHILPTSKFQQLFLYFTYFLQASVNSMRENCECKTVNTVHWFDASCSVIPLNNSITLISPVQSL